MEHFEKIRQAKQAWIYGTISRQELLQIIRNNPASWTFDGGNAVAVSPLGDGEVIVLAGMAEHVNAQIN